MNIPFFLSISYRIADLEYKPEYLESLYSGAYQTGGGIGTATIKNAADRMNHELGVLYGVQFRLNNTLYLPIFGTAHRVAYSSLIDNEWVYLKDEVDALPHGTTGEEKTPLRISFEDINGFFGTGLHINTDMVKGGIYLGVIMSTQHQITDRYKLLSESHPVDYGDLSFSFKAALAPVVNTSSWAYVGKVLNNVLGFLGMGDNVIYYAEDERNSKIIAFVDAINAGLDFTFNKMYFGPFSMQANIVYSRENYDAAAKDNMYGLKLQGQFSNFPFGLSLEGGYRQFFSVAQYMENDYTDTGYFNGSIYFPFKKITFGMIYRYDNIYKSKFTFAVSTNFLSGLFTLNPVEQFMDKDKFSSGEGNDFGIRYRHAGWRAKPKE
jgi:hypothetical protein